MQITYNDAGDVAGLTINGSRYSPGALATILATWARQGQEVARLRNALRDIAGCDISTLCPECAALAREVGGEA